MYIPDTISRNILSVLLGNNVKSLNKNYFTSDNSNPTQVLVVSLKRLCLYQIIKNWEVNPVLNDLTLGEDVRFVLDHLSTDLPFELIVNHIYDELYWRRAFRARWPGKMLRTKPFQLDYEIPNQFNRDNSKNNGKIIKLNTWKGFYIEKHLQHILEQLKPEEYKPDKMKELIELTKDYIVRLKMNQLQAPIVKDKERIPLNAILPALPNLKELIICFKQTYAGDNFSWHLLQTTQRDIDNLATGLRACCKLNVLRIINSDITCNKVMSIACNLMENHQLTTLDFSHCKIADNGTIAICKLLLELPTLQELNLMNNYIGLQGIEMISFTLSQSDVKLKQLDLSLNKFDSPVYCKHLARMLAKNTELNVLILSACGLTVSDGKSLIDALKVNETLTKLDLSNNNFDEETGHLFMELVKEANYTLQQIDLRMTSICAEVTLTIDDLLWQRNRERRRRQRYHQDGKLRDLMHAKNALKRQQKVDFDLNKVEEQVEDKGEQRGQRQEQEQQQKQDGKMMESDESVVVGTENEIAIDPIVGEIALCNDNDDGDELHKQQNVIEVDQIEIEEPNENFIDGEKLQKMLDNVFNNMEILREFEGDEDADGDEEEADDICEEFGDENDANLVNEEKVEIYKDQRAT